MSAFAPTRKIRASAAAAAADTFSGQLEITVGMHWHIHHEPGDSAKGGPTVGQAFASFAPPAARHWHLPIQRASNYAHAGRRLSSPRRGRTDLSARSWASPAPFRGAGGSAAEGCVDPAATRRATATDRDREATGPYFNYGRAFSSRLDRHGRSSFKIGIEKSQGLLHRPQGGSARDLAGRRRVASAPRGFLALFSVPGLWPERRDGL